MATLYISEFQESSQSSLPLATMPPLAEQTVAIGGGSVQSAAFRPSTGIVRLSADSICSIAVGANPTATATTLRLSANVPEYFNVSPGQKLAVITNT